MFPARHFLIPVEDSVLSNNTRAYTELKNEYPFCVDRDYYALPFRVANVLEYLTPDCHHDEL